MKRIPIILFQIGVVMGVLTLCSCQSATEGGGPGGNGNANPLWIYIEQPYYAGSAASIELRGEAYCEACPSPYWSEACGPFYSAPSSIDVSWSNRTTGSGGTTFHGILSDCDHVYYQYYFTAYSHVWTATVPLEEGGNLIAVMASGMGYSILDTVAVYRDLTPPTSPQNISATAISAGRIDLAWDDSTDDVSVYLYKLFRDGMWIMSKYAYSTTMSDSGVGPAKTYCYMVTALDGVGNESAPSGTVCATTP